LKDDLEKNRRALELFAAAEKKVEAGSIYGKRLALVADYLKALKSRGDQLARPRGPVPEQRLNDEAAGIKVDGRLDEPYWQEFPSFAGGRLKGLNKKQKPAFGTNFKVAWGKENIYFAISCAESNACPLNIGTTKNDDPAIWQGDVVDILLETDAHSYYQIAVNPAGAVADLDRAAGKEDFSWSSQAEIAVSTNDGSWIIEARIPVVEDANDPLHQVVGRKPVYSLPWFFNICRRRARESGVELSAFSPAGLPEINDAMKFGKLTGKKKERKREPLFGTNAAAEAAGSSPGGPGLAGDGE